jgi:beta-lactam-binding protein with PASTA domain
VHTDHRQDAGRGLDESAVELYEPPPDQSVRVVVAVCLLMLVAFAGLRWWLGEAGLSGVNNEDARAEVPDVAGIPEAEARALIEEAGLDVVVSPALNVAVPAGVVIAQDPRGGSLLEPGASVLLSTSMGSGFVVVPEVTGTIVDELDAQLAAYGLVVGETTTREDVNSLAGEILEQDPPPGEMALGGSAIAVVVSEGPPPVEVPDVRGVTEAEAVRTLTEAGFTADPVLVYSSARRGTVVSTNPRGGVEAEYGSTIRVYVSRGAAPVTTPPPTTPVAPTPPTTPPPTGGPGGGPGPGGGGPGPGGGGGQGGGGPGDG